VVNMSWSVALILMVLVGKCSSLLNLLKKYKERKYKMTCNIKDSDCHFAVVRQSHSVNTVTIIAWGKSNSL